MLDRGEAPVDEGTDARPSRRLSGAATVRTFARLVSAPAARRPSVTRLTLAIVLSLGLLAVLVTGGARMLRATVAWLHGQPDYVCRFRDISLEPDPPPWIRSGRDGLLERVRSDAGLPEWLSVLDQDLDVIERAFALHSPWVERVERVERIHPNRLVVRLRYREPVAEARCDDRQRIVVDGDGVILPLDDLDRAAAGQLVEIPAPKPPLDPRPGRFWAIGEATGDVAKPDPEVAAAARLAAFFKQRQGQAGELPAEWRIVFLHIDTSQLEPEARRAQLAAGGFKAATQHRTALVNPQYAPRLWAEAANKTLILWSDPPGQEPPGDLTADQKWSLLREWFHNPAATPLKHPDFLEFSKRRVKPHGAGPQSESGAPREGARG